MKPHWNLRYIACRLAQRRFHKRNPDLPWMNRRAIEAFGTILKPTDQMVEFGCGRSTKWFSQKVAHLISVEHQEKWARMVREQLARANVKNVELKYFPAPYREEGPASLTLEYACWIDKLPDRSIDVVLIDGGCRGATSLKSIPKLRSGGVLAIDNVNWYLPSTTLAPASRSIAEGPYNEIWAQVWAILSRWRHVWISDNVSDTAFFFKP